MLLPEQYPATANHREDFEICIDAERLQVERPMSGLTRTALVTPAVLHAVAESITEVAQLGVITDLFDSEHPLPISTQLFLICILTLPLAALEIAGNLRAYNEGYRAYRRGFNITGYFRARYILPFVIMLAGSIADLVIEIKSGVGDLTERWPSRLNALRIGMYILLPAVTFLQSLTVEGTAVFREYAELKESWFAKALNNIKTGNKRVATLAITTINLLGSLFMGLLSFRGTAALSEKLPFWLSMSFSGLLASLTVARDLALYGGGTYENVIEKPNKEFWKHGPLISSIAVVAGLLVGCIFFSTQVEVLQEIFKRNPTLTAYLCFLPGAAIRWYQAYNVPGRELQVMAARPLPSPDPMDEQDRHTYLWSQARQALGVERVPGGQVERGGYYVRPLFAFLNWRVADVARALVVIGGMLAAHQAAELIPVLEGLPWHVVLCVAGALVNLFWSNLEHTYVHPNVYVEGGSPHPVIPHAASSGTFGLPSASPTPSPIPSPTISPASSHNRLDLVSEEGDEYEDKYAAMPLLTRASQLLPTPKPAPKDPLLAKPIPILPSNQPWHHIILTSTGWRFVLSFIVDFLMFLILTLVLNIASRRLIAPLFYGNQMTSSQEDSFALGSSIIGGTLATWGSGVFCRYIDRNSENVTHSSQHQALHSAPIPGATSGESIVNTQRTISEELPIPPTLGFTSRMSMASSH